MKFVNTSKIYSSKKKKIAGNTKFKLFKRYNHLSIFIDVYSLNLDYRN